MVFPNKFCWGVATASYQIEGAAYRAGGGMSVWDMFCRRPGKIWNGETGDVACDHYNRFTEDVKLLKELGIQGYRMSISWPRILPDGTGRTNEEGLAFYDRLIDALLEAGVTPYVTLFHWDLPYELYCRGGWLNRESVKWFEEYTRLVVQRLSDRVAHWMTLNEPQCFIGLGLQSGLHAPGDSLGFAEILRAAHHTLMAHGRAVQVIRSEAKSAPVIGYAPVGVVKSPVSESDADREAARAMMFQIAGHNLWNNTWWTDPLLLGGYPEDGLSQYGHLLPEIMPGDLELMHQPIDFLGANIYNSHPVKAGDNGPEETPHPAGIGRTSYQWPVTPDALYWGARFFWERYHKPIVITENGLGNNDWVSLDGKVHDPQRIDFLQRYLLGLEKAIEYGVEVQGYFQWSLMDNFEWHEGYKMRFGLVYVDYLTQQRIPKDSAYWYKKVIETNGIYLHEGEQERTGNKVL